MLGAALTALSIFLNFKVKDKEWWEEQEREMNAAHSCVRKLVAENAQLHVALAAGEMTDDAKKVVTMTLASFEADIAGTEKDA